MSKLQILSGLGISATLVLVAASCDGSRGTEPGMAGHDHPVVASDPSSVRFESGLANKVRSAMSRYHSKDEASDAGYELASPCVQHPTAGGMGFHWVNGGDVDPVFDPMQPEAVLYGPNGKLIAIEYIVINTGQARPAFDGYQFDIGGAPLPVAHWTLHVWLWQQNPNGLFNPWNPTIACQ